MNLRSWHRQSNRTRTAFEVVDEVAGREWNLRSTVKLEIQGKVDTNHPDTGRTGLTLAAKERVEARQWEIE